MNLGSDEVIGLMLGDVKVDRAYLGDKEVINSGLTAWTGNSRLLGALAGYGLETNGTEFNLVVNGARSPTLVATSAGLPDGTIRATDPESPYFEQWDIVSNVITFSTYDGVAPTSITYSVETGFSGVSELAHSGYRTENGAIFTGIPSDALFATPVRLNMGIIPRVLDGSALSDYSGVGVDTELNGLYFWNEGQENYPTLPMDQWGNISDGSSGIPSYGMAVKSNFFTWEYPDGLLGNITTSGDVWYDPRDGLFYGSCQADTRDGIRHVVETTTFPGRLTYRYSDYSPAPTDSIGT